MIYIENPEFFFEKIEELAFSMIDYIDEHKGEAFDAILFKEPKSDGTYAISCFLPQESEEKESEEQYVCTLDYESLCQYSLDNSVYYSSTETDEIAEISDIMSPDTKAKDYKLCIRDITGTFYTVITPQTKTILNYFNERYLSTTCRDSESSDIITVFYHNVWFAHRIIGKKVGIEISADDLDNVTFVSVEVAEERKLCWRFQPLKLSDFEDDLEFFFKDEPRDPELVKTINESRDKYLKLLKDNPAAFSLFEKKFDLKFNKNYPHMSILAHGLDYYFKDPFIVKDKNRLFENIVINPVKESKQFDMERFVTDFACDGQRAYISASADFFIMFINLYARFPEWYSAGVIKKDLIEEDIFGKEVIRYSENPLPLFDELPTLQYVMNYMLIMYEGYETAVQYQKDVDDFSNDFEVYGGGFGIGGALKGMLTGAIINTVAQSAYSAYKYSKLNPEKYEAMSSEFMVSKQSQGFFKELIEADLIYLLIKTFCATRRYILENYNEIEIDVDCEKLLESYTKAYKLYSIALAKHLKLVCLPAYDGFENYFDSTPEKLMQEVLLLFPYHAGYYKKYIEFGGRMSEELKNYAEAHFVNVSDLYNKEKERIEKEKKAAEEKDKKEEEQKKKREEEKRKKEEFLKKELSSLSEKYGDLPTRYPEVFKLLLGNPIFAESKDSEITDHNRISDNVFKYLSEKYSSNQNTNLFSGTSEKFNNKKYNIKSVHGADKIKDNNVLMVFDITVFGSAKDGFVITNENICARNSFEQPFSVPIKDIKSLSIKEKRLIINKRHSIDIGISCVKPNEFLYIFSYCVCSLLYLADKGYKVSAPIVPANTPPNQPSVQNSSQFVNSAAGTLKSIFGKINSTIESVTSTKSVWKCDCGKDVSEDNNFCPNCGAKRPEKLLNWVCSNCQNKNPKDSNFCGKCGTKR